MRQILSTLCLAVAATVCCGAFAQGAPSGAAPSQAERAQRFNERMTHLKARLKITSAQEGAWDAFVQAMQPQPHPEQHADAGGQKLTAPQRLDRIEARRQEMDAAEQRHDQAIRTLYGQLNPEQQKILDGVIARMQRHEHHHGGAQAQAETSAH